VTEHKT